MAMRGGVSRRYATWVVGGRSTGLERPAYLQVAAARERTLPQRQWASRIIVLKRNSRLKPTEEFIF